MLNYNIHITQHILSRNVEGHQLQHEMPGTRCRKRGTKTIGGLAQDMFIFNVKFKNVRFMLMASSSDKKVDITESLDPTDRVEEAEMPDELLDLVAGGGNPPTNTPESTGSVKSM